MGRDYLVGNRLAELEAQLFQINQAKQRVLNYTQKLDDLYDSKKISYKEYIEKSRSNLNGRTPKEWVVYYDSLIKECEKNIRKTQKISKKDVFKKVFLSLILLGIIFSGFFLTPTFIGFVTQENVEDFSEQVNLTFENSEVYEWNVSNLGELAYFNFDGSFEGDSFEIYIDDVLVYSFNSNPNYSSVMTGNVVGSSSDAGFFKKIIGAITGKSVGNNSNSEEINSVETSNPSHTNEAPHSSEKNKSYSEKIEKSQNPSHTNESSQFSEVNNSNSEEINSEEVLDNETNPSHTNVSEPSHSSGENSSKQKEIFNKSNSEEINSVETSNPSHTNEAPHSSEKNKSYSEKIEKSQNPSHTNESSQFSEEQRVVSKEFFKECRDSCDLSGKDFDKSSYEIKIKISKGTLKINNFNYGVFSKVEIVNDSNIENKTVIQKKAEIEKPVQWEEHVRFNKKSRVELDLPDKADKVKVLNNETKEEVSVKKKSRKDNVLETEEEVFEIVVEYETEAPVIEEKVLKDDEDIFEKEVVISSEIHYENVSAYVDLDEEVRYKEQIEIQEFVFESSKNVSIVDSDGNGLYDRVEWIVDGLSEKKFVVRNKKNIVRHLDEKTDELILGNVNKKIKYKEEVNILSGDDFKVSGVSDIEKVEFRNERALDAEVNFESSDFVLARWNDEVQLKVDLGEGFESSTTQGTTLNFSKEKERIDFRVLDVDDLNEDGGVEFDVVLSEKPKKNVFEFSIEADNLDFFYQPALDVERNNNSCNATDCGGMHRPENVVNSYAVYHSSKANNEYKTGKAFHIYRPKVYDAEGNWVWGNLNVDEEKGILSVEVDEGFLNEAVYPVTIDPSFGYTSQGGTLDKISSIFGGKFSSGGSGNLESITAYISSSYWFSSSGFSFQYSIYEDGTDGAQVDVTEEYTISGSESNGWFTLDFPSTPASISNQNYWLYAWDNGNMVEIAMDSSGGDSRYRDVYVNYNSWPSTLDDADFSINGNDKLSIYANYTLPIPDTPSPEILTSTNNYYYNEDLNCSANITDGNSEDLNVSVRWYKNGELNTTLNYNESYSSGIIFNSTLLSGNTTAGENWSCSMQLNDGTNSSDWGNSSNVTINDYILISVSKLSPSGNAFNVTQNEFFKIELNTTCLVGSCGSVNVSLDPVNDIILNGDFETGDFTDWDKTGAASVSSSDSYSGTYSLDVVQGLDMDYSNVSQSFDSTSSATKLCFYEKGYVEACCDHVYIYVNDSSGNSQLLGDLNGNNSGSWTQTCFDISSYNPVQGVTFMGYNDVADASTLFIDDICLADDNGECVSDSKSGLINTTAGAIPFYTNASSNPLTTSSLSSGQSETVTFWVNATGSLSSTSEFFAFVNLTSSLSISNESSHWNVTISNESSFQIAPTTPSPDISTSTGNNFSSEDLNCSATINDDNSDDLNVSVRWYKNGELNLTQDFNNSYSSGSVFSSLLLSGNTTAGENWSCSMQLNDGEDSSDWGSSENLTIENPTLVSVSKLSPSGDAFNVTQNEFFEVELNVTCLAGSCGSVNVSLDPESSPYMKVQRGETSFGSGDSSLDVPINETDISNAFIIVYGRGPATDLERVEFTAEFVNSTAIRIQRGESGTATTATWQIIEADSSAPTPAFEVQTDEVSVGSSDTVVNVPINEVSNISNSVVFYSARQANGDVRTRMLYRAGLTNSTNIQFNRTTSGTTSEIRWWVVTFKDDFYIQKDSVAMSSSTASDTISSVNLSRSAVFITWDADTNGLAQTSPRAYLSSSTQINFDRETSTGSCNINYVVVEFPEGVVVQSDNGVSSPTLDIDTDVTLSNSVSLNETWNVHSNKCTGTGTAYPRPYVTSHLSDSDTLELREDYSGQTKTVTYYVIDTSNYTFSGGEKSGLIPVGSGTPFYTNASTNPLTTSSLSSGQSEIITFWVNATGDVDTTHEFFGFVNLTSNPSVSNESEHWNVTIVESGSGPFNTAPTTPAPDIFTATGNNYTNEDLNCSATISDDDSDDLNVSVRWYKNGVLNLTQDFNNSYSSGSVFSSLLLSGNTTAGENWSCSMQLNDGEDSSDWGSSENLTIESLPLSNELTDCANITEAGKYTLTQNVSLNSGVCFNISADDVVFDCEGHRISTEFVPDYGFYVENTTLDTQNITLRNCTIYGPFSKSIGIFDDNVIVEDFVIESGPTQAIVFGDSDGDGSILRRIEIDSSGFGPFIEGNLMGSGYVSVVNVSISGMYSGDFIGSGFNFTNTNFSYGITSLGNNSFTGCYFEGTPVTIYNDYGGSLFYNNVFNISTLGGGYFDSTSHARQNLNVTNQSGERIFGNGTQIGGNYWTNSSGTGYSDTCEDSNADGFCDNPYNATDHAQEYYTDYLPLSDEYLEGGALNTAPTTPAPDIFTATGNNYTNETINCSATINDDNSDDLNVSVRWYKNGGLNTTLNYNGSYSSGSVFSSLLLSGNTTAGENWSCSMQLNDGEDSSDWGSSENLTIESLPSEDKSINITTIYPTGDINVTQNEFFNVSFNVTCLSGSCGSVNVSLDPWLSGWSKRIEITINSSNIDEELTHFPIPIILGTSAGQNNDDVSAVFDEVGNDWQKIAVADSSGSELYVEKEYWNSTEEKAVLWVSKSDWSISNTSDTTLYLYYDSDHADNNAYVANSGSRTEVWDGNFTGVYHMAEDPSGTDPQMIDSTSNENSGSSVGSMTTDDLVNAKVSKGIEFDGSGDLIDLNDPSEMELDLNDGLTIQCWAYPTKQNWDVGLIKRGHQWFNTEDNQYLLYADTRSGVERATFGIGNGTTRDNAASDSGAVPYNTWKFITGRLSDSGELQVFIDGLPNGSSVSKTITSVSTQVETYIGTNKYNGVYMEGTMDEVRFSNIDRSNAWIKADYYALNDSLLIFGSEETSSSGSKSGLISTTPGTTPFYTNASSNPLTTSSLSSGQSEIVTFYVNATGDVDTTHEFFGYVNLTSNLSIGNESEHWNVTIVEEVSETNPQIIEVFNSTMTDVSSGPNEGPLPTHVLINFSAYDPQGFSNLNDGSAEIIFGKDGEPTRSNSCARITSESSGNYANYSCNVSMWWFDSAGEWAITASIEDDDSNTATNNSQTFYLGLTTGFVSSPSDLTWDSINPGSTNQLSNNDPIVLNNTGNDDVLVQVRAKDLLGEQDYSKALYAGNFTANTVDACEGTQMENNTNVYVSGANLYRGNYTFNNGTAQEQVYFCLEQAGSELTNQAYSTSAYGSWTVRILLVFVVTRRRKKHFKEDKLYQALILVKAELQERYSSEKQEVLEMLIKELSKKYSKAKKEIVSEFVLNEQIKIPVSIFNKELGALEAVVKYMKENLAMTYKDISEKLKRDERTIWTSYNKAKEKKVNFIIEGNNLVLLDNLIKNNLTILENLVVYLKNSGLRYSEVSELINRDQRNVWRIYNKCKGKVKKVISEVYIGEQKSDEGRMLKVLKLIKESLKEEFNENKKNILSLLSEGFKEFLIPKDVEIPVSIFNKELGALEAVVKYMKENLAMTYKEISEKLQRDERTIWTSYNKAKEKFSKNFILKETENFISLSEFNLKVLTILENLVVYLKNSGLRYSEVSELINRDQRNVWTLYSKSIVKLNQRNI